MSKINNVVAAFLGALVFSSAGMAQLDKSKTIVCAIMETKSCVLRAGCITGGAELVNLPDFVKIDLAAQKLTGKRADGSELLTPIERVEATAELLIVQGSENGVGWSLVVSLDTGAMTGSANTEDAGMLVFGACTQ